MPPVTRLPAHLLALVLLAGLAVPAGALPLQLELSCVADTFGMASIKTEDPLVREAIQSCNSGTTTVVTDGTLDGSGELDTSQPWTYYVESTMAPDSTGTTVLLDHEGLQDTDGTTFSQPMQHISLGDYTFDVPGSSGTREVDVAVVQTTALSGAEIYDELQRLELVDSGGTVVADLTGTDGVQSLSLAAGATYTLSTELRTEYTNLTGDQSFNRSIELGVSTVPEPSTALLLAGGLAGLGLRRPR